MKESRSTILKLLLTISILLITVVFCLSPIGLHFIKYSSPEDTKLFIWLNHRHNRLWDPIMYLASDKLFWFPFYGLIIYFLYRNFGKQFWQALISIALLIAATDQITSGLIKNTVKRLRPSHEPDLIPIIHFSKAGAGGMYGFVSSHTANAFALMVFIVLLMDKSFWPLKFILVVWAVLVSYSRIYNGVHYPIDVGMAVWIGSLLGFIFYWLHLLSFQKLNPKHRLKYNGVIIY